MCRSRADELRQEIARLEAAIADMALERQRIHEESRAVAAACPTRDVAALHEADAPFRARRANLKGRRAKAHDDLARARAELRRISSVQVVAQSAKQERLKAEAEARAAIEKRRAEEARLRARRLERSIPRAPGESLEVALWREAMQVLNDRARWRGPNEVFYARKKLLRLARMALGET